MKFILNENKKFILEERFILTEASAAEVAKTWTTKLNAYFENATKVLDAYIQIVSDETKKPTSTADAEKDLASRGAEGKKAAEAVENLEDTLALPTEEIEGEAKDFKNIRTDVTRCHDALETAIKNLTLKNNLKRFVTAQLQTLEDLSKKTPWAAADIEDLKEALGWLSENILPLFDTAEQSKTIETDKTKLQKFVATCKKGLDLIEDINIDLKDFKFEDGSNEDLRAYRELVQPLLTETNLQLKAADKVTAFTNDEKQKFIDEIDNHQTQVENIVTQLDKISKSALLASTKEKEDWKTKFTSAPDSSKMAVIEEFIYTTWPFEAESVIKIKEAVLAACKVHGFNLEGAAKNPFFDFISKVYIPYKLSADVYNAVHNSVARKNLEAKDLSAEGVLKAGNIIFCKALYSLKPEAIKVYIKKQHNLLNANIAEGSGFKQKSDLAFSTIYDIDPPVLDGAASKSSKDLKLRSMDAIEKLEAKWTGSVSGTEEEKPVTVNEELLKKIGSKENAIKVAVALVIKFSSSEKVKEAADKCKEIKAELAKSVSFDKMRALLTNVETTYKLAKITADQATLLIKNIIEYSVFGLTTE
jgi:hypothetical protein